MMNSKSQSRFPTQAYMNKSGFSFSGQSKESPVEKMQRGFGDYTNVQTMPVSAYVGKRSSKQRLARVKSASANKFGNVFSSTQTKTFYPESYFKRVGYQKDHPMRKSDTLGQLVR